MDMLVILGQNYSPNQGPSIRIGGHFYIRAGTDSGWEIHFPIGDLLVVK
jgi:hypothetical protein